MNKENSHLNEIFLAGGCLWGVQEFVRHLPGVTFTEAGRANGTEYDLNAEYDGYAECVRTQFSSTELSIPQLMSYFYEIIDPYSLNRQGPDAGLKYRTGVYSKSPSHLTEVREFIDAREDSNRIVVEVLHLLFYVRSAEEHQDRLTKYPNEKCHIPKEVLFRYR